MWLRLFSSILLVLCVTNCVSNSADIEKIKQTITRYDALLTEGFVKLDIAPLKEVVTENHMDRLGNRLSTLKTAKRRMDSKLKNIEFLEFAFPDKQSASVKTRETWDVRHINTQTGKTVKEIKGLCYVLSYRLLKKNGKWLVEAVDVIEEKVH